MTTDSRDEPRTEPDSDDTYPLTPVDPQQGSRLPAVFTDPAKRVRRRKKRRPWFQFSMAESLALMVSACLSLSMLGCLPGGYAPTKIAGLAGVGTLLGLLAMTVFKPDRAIVHVAWWGLLLFYLGTCIAAILQDG